MQRDVKIGLSLGLLLVVVVAALFFRREPEQTASLPQLSDPESLNQAIGERERSPYPPPAPDELAGPPAPPPSARKAEQAVPRPRVPGILASDDQSLHERLLSSMRTDVPDPIPANRQELPPSLAERDGIEAPAGNGVRTHTIKAGDRLSVLAARYLGSATRYGEIFEANKGVLKNANQLPVGVTIVIPPKNPPRSLPVEPARETRPPADEPARPVANTQPEEPRKEKEPAADSAPEKKLFSPSRRGPFASGRIGLPRTRTTEPPPRLAPDDEPSLPRIDVNDRSDLFE